MKRPRIYVVIKPQVRAGRNETVFPVIAPMGEIFCAFTLDAAVKFRNEAQLYRRKYGRS